jgi:hypothetical protein
MLRHATHFVLGLILLAVVYLLLNLKVSQFVLAILALVTRGSLNLLFLAIVVTLMAIGIGTRRWGLALAPAAFVALWFSASVAQRLEIERTSDPQLSERPVPSNLRSIKTLMVEQQGIQTCCRQYSKLLADGYIDRYVLVDRNNRTGERSGEITAYRLARDSGCSAEDRRRSFPLAQVGRTDECFVSEKLADVPDGIVLHMKGMDPGPAAAIRCCDEGTINVRSGGAEQTVAIWRSGQRPVLSYLPFLGYFAKPGDLWDLQAVGPFQLVRVGGPDFDTETMAAAIYGIGWGDPFEPARVDRAELLRRAMELARKDDTSALDVALSLQAKGFVDDDIIRIAVFLINDYTTDHRIKRFWGALTDDQKRTFVRLLLERIQDPAAGYEHGSARLPFGVSPDLRAEVAESAANIFAERRDLKIWQYEIALRLVHGVEQQRLFQTLVDDTTPGFARRAIAFKTVWRTPTDEERKLFAERLDLVPDALVEEYVRVTGWHRNHGVEKQTSEATYDFRRRALARFATIQDEDRRRSAQGWFRDINRE